MAGRRRRSPFLIPLVIASVITVLLGAILVYLELGDSFGKTETEAESEENTEISIPGVLFHSDLSEFEKYMDVTDEKYLILVNKENTVDGSFTPETLVKVKDARKDIELSVTAERALEAMFIEMRALGFKGVFVTSAYRSYNYQSSLFNTYINDEMGRGLSYEKAKEKVLTYSAFPGTSEHHTGLSVDLMCDGMVELDESFADYPVYEWLLENAWKFGFVLRYPEDKTDVTGYTYEPWHYRFVGRYHAYVMKERDLTLEEYLVWLSEN